MFNWCNKASDRSGIRGWREEIIHAITPLTHLSDYQLASVDFIVCIYSKSRLFYSTFFCNVWVVFVTHILYDSPESAFASSARRYFAFSSGESSSQCHFILSNIGLFHVIYKTVNDFMQSKPSHLNEPHQFFLRL